MNAMVVVHELVRVGNSAQVVDSVLVQLVVDHKLLQVGGFAPIQLVGCKLVQKADFPLVQLVVGSKMVQVVDSVLVLLVVGCKQVQVVDCPLLVQLVADCKGVHVKGS